MNFSLVENTIAWKQFYRDVKEGLGHAYIFISEDGEQLASFLHFAALACFCPDVCCECETCQSVADGSHPDVYRKNGDGMKVKDDMEPLLDRVEMCPVKGSRKVFVIENADKMNPVCQNKLLKTFEEPPAYVTMILGASSESGLLSTIRSRGKKLYPQPLASSQIVGELTEDGFDGDTAAIAAAYSMGNLQKARQFAEGGNYRDQYEQVFEMLMTLKKSGQIAEYVVGPNFTKEKIALTLDFMDVILSDAMKELLQTDAQRFTVGRERDLRQVAAGFSAQGIAMSLEAINVAREQLKFNVNAANVASGVLFAILEARYKWQKK